MSTPTGGAGTRPQDAATAHRAAGHPGSPDPGTRPGNGPDLGPASPAVTTSRATRTALILAPLALLGLAALATVPLGLHGEIVLTARVPVVLSVTGALLSAGLAVVTLRGTTRTRRLDRADADADARAAAREQLAHRRFLLRLDHELKNPVTAIRSALASGDPVPAAHVRIAAGQARRVGDLVGQLRALSSLETRELEHLPVELGPVIEEEVEAVREELAARGVRRTLGVALPTVPWPLPPVLGDADLLRVVIRNLVMNAVKYADDGALVEVRGTESEGSVTLEVADTGWGIRPEHLALVWEELWRADDARALEGTGLGLNLVRLIVLRHRGEVSLSSVHGRGTRVQVRLPVAPRHP